jgi:hypothetical protein
MQEDYAEFGRLFEAAEQRLKSVETDVGEIFIPALNELRYAGYHCVKSLQGDEEKKQHHIIQGQRHCKRALCDVLEAGIYFHLDRIRLFNVDYLRDPITDEVADYAALKSQVAEAQQFLASNTLHKSRAEWVICDEHYRTLKAVADRLEAARPELNKRRRNRLTVYWLAALGIVATVVIGAVQVLITLF